MQAFLSLLDLFLVVAIVLLLARLVVEWVLVLARHWRPQGLLLVLTEAIFTATDPPLKAVRRVLPPLRLGAVQLDLAFLVVLLLASLARGLVASAQ